MRRIRFPWCISAMSSSTMPYFEETLLEDGYADMYAIMKQLVRCNYNGQLNIDHPFFNQDGERMSDLSAAYFMGYIESASAQRAGRRCKRKPL